MRLPHWLTAFITLWALVPSTGGAREIPAYLSFADVFDHDHPEDSELTLRALEQDAAGAGDKVVQAEILTQIARSEGLEKRFTEAYGDLDRASAIAPRSTRVVIYVDIERGRLLRLQGSTAQADQLFHRAFAEARAARADYLLLDAVHMIALAEPFDASRAWTERGLRIAATSTDRRTIHWIAVLNNNLGVAYFERGDYIRAEGAYRAALIADREQGADVETLVNAQFSLAQDWRKLGRIKEALALQTRLHDQGGDRALPSIDLEIAECRFAMGQFGQARYWAHMALQRGPASFSQADLDRLKVLGER
ncbi:MAG TPA: tetratricopeptide repeat protein [Xanthomonadaceae bacterium]|jgi:tetratricopeptide (TPR) repeat protein|nr:tetratricopeptide repeat protein [Xanthomonadaceae bacterium]